ncbi:MAG: type II toxin-antitoxin system Phd/YefM family antitoxin [Limnochordia bacterium]|jgi:Uma2 family endonuclease|nr:type II toxin-antitoxin system Phd/YefM family antitoxin [Limnochordia bacterium]
MKVNSTDFQNAVGKYLALLEREPVIITKNGRSVARITAYTDPSDFFINEAKGKYNVRSQIRYEEYLDLVENSDQRYELIRGEIYLLASPSFQHQVIVRDVSMQLQNFLSAGPCQAVTAPLDVRLYGWATKFSEDPNVVQPDVVVICDPERVNDDGRYEGTPTLIVEVLAPSTRSRDLITKLELYRRSGIQEYWIVDPKEEAITQYSFDERREPENIRMIKGGEVLQSAIFEGLELDTASLFMNQSQIPR